MAATFSWPADFHGLVTPSDPFQGSAAAYNEEDLVVLKVNRTQFWGGVALQQAAGRMLSEGDEVLY
jgi:hypothetical protein